MTATVHSKNYTNDLPLTFAAPSQEKHGIRHHLTTDGKQLVLIFPDVQARLISGSFGDTRLAVNEQRRGRQRGRASRRQPAPHRPAPRCRQAERSERIDKRR